MKTLAKQLGLTYKWTHLFMSFVKIPGMKFEMQITPVTQGQWSSIMGSNPSYFKNIVDAEVCPVERVSFDDCLEFINKLNKQDNLYTYRLPNKQEWEYCCTKEMDAKLDQYAICDTTSTKPVGTKLSNKYGLYDMLGNVWEWTDSLYDGSKNRLVCGGSWDFDAQLLRSARRFNVPPGNADADVGFRLVRTLKK